MAVHTSHETNTLSCQRTIHGPQPMFTIDTSITTIPRLSINAHTTSSKPVSSSSSRIIKRLHRQDSHAIRLFYHSQSVESMPTFRSPKIQNAHHVVCYCNAAKVAIDTKIKSKRQSLLVLRIRINNHASACFQAICSSCCSCKMLELCLAHVGMDLTIS